MPTQAQLMAEAYRRGILPPQRAALYEEAARRGIVNDNYAQGRLNARQGFAGGAAGFLNTLERSTGLDNVTAGLGAIAEAGGNALTGRGPTDVGQTWNHQRAIQQGYIDQYQHDQPILSQTAKGLGTVAQVAGVMATGGASEAPTAVNAVSSGLRAVAGRMAVRTGRNAMTGALLSGANAAAQPGTAQERLDAATNALGPGAAIGAAFPAGVGALGGAARVMTNRVARPLGAMASEGVDAASRVLTGKAPSMQAAPISPALAARGQQNALSYLSSIGATPEALTAAQGNAFGKPITAAEALGPTGISQAAGLARRAGATPGLAQATMQTRGGDRMNRILADIHETTGVDPAAARGDIDAMVSAGRAKAGPLFDAVRGQPGPVTSPQLTSILNRPVVQTAAGRASNDLLNAGVDPEAHGFVLGPPRAPPAPQTTPGADDLSQALADVKLWRSNPQQTGGLFRAIQEAGGMKVRNPDGSQVAGPDVLGSLNGRTAPGLINNQSGMSPERMAEHLQEKGWFEPNVSDPSAAFESALAEHAGGNAQFKPGAYPADYQQRLDGLDQEMRGADVSFHDPASVSAAKLATFRGGDAAEQAATQWEGNLGGDPHGAEFDRLSAPMVSVKGLTPHALDLVRQNLGDMVDRDAFGRVIPDSASRGNYNVNLAKGDLTNVLAGSGDQPGLIPGYRDALDSAGDYLSTKAAFDRTQGKLFGTSGPANDPRAFASYFGGLAPGEQDASRAAMANDIFTKLQNGQLAPKAFDAPAVQQKLQTAFGDSAGDLVDRMKAEADMSAAASRMTPNMNSVTGDVLGSQADQGGSQAAMGFARAGINAFAGRPVSALHGLASGLAPFASAARQPAGMATRDALGNLLYGSPADAAQALQGKLSAAPPDPGPIPHSITALQNAFAIMAAKRGEQGAGDPAASGAGYQPNAFGP